MNIASTSKKILHSIADFNGVVKEPNEEQAVRIMEGLRDRYEAHHKVHFTMMRFVQRLRFLIVIFKIVSCLIKQLTSLMKRALVCAFAT